MTPGWFVEGPWSPQRLKGHWHHCSGLTQCWALRGKKKKDDLSKIIKWIDLCAAITRTLADRNPSCQAYFTSCTAKQLYIVSLEPDFVENDSPCTTTGHAQDEDECLCVILYSHDGVFDIVPVPSPVRPGVRLPRHCGTMSPCGRQGRLTLYNWWCKTEGKHPVLIAIILLGALFGPWRD